MKNIGLITIHRSNNYGAVLQTYATLKVLSKFGAVKLIDYQNSFLTKELDLVRFGFSVHGLLMACHDVLRLSSKIKAVRNFERFFESEYKLTEPFTKKQLNSDKLASQFDVFICGSDQIWNPLVVSPRNDIDSAFFLDFGPPGKTKMSFASSIGHYRYSEKEQEIVRGLLQDFSFISTREVDGQEHLQSFIPEKKIFQMIDPTLLLGKDEWMELSKRSTVKYKFEGAPYILVYSVPRTGLIKETAEYYAQLLSLPVVEISQNLNPVSRCNYHIKDAGPYEFVRLFANAQFIITDSFHGACFSLNFNKPFASVSSGVRANRTQSLFHLLDLPYLPISDVRELTPERTYKLPGCTAGALAAIRDNAISVISGAVDNI